MQPSPGLLFTRVTLRLYGGGAQIPGSPWDDTPPPCPNPCLNPRYPWGLCEEDTRSEKWNLKIPTQPNQLTINHLYPQKRFFVYTIVVHYQNSYQSNDLCFLIWYLRRCGPQQPSRLPSPPLRKPTDIFVPQNLGVSPDRYC